MEGICSSDLVGSFHLLLNGSSNPRNREPKKTRISDAFARSEVNHKSQSIHQPEKEKESNKDSGALTQ